LNWCGEKPGLTATHRLPTPRPPPRAAPPPPRAAPTAQATPAAPESGSLRGSAAGLRRVPSTMRATARAEPCRKRRRKPIATCSFCPSAFRPPFRRNDAPVHPTSVWGVTCQFVVSGARPAHTRPAQCRILRSSCGRDHPTRPREKRRGRRERRPLGPAWVKPTQAGSAPSIKERSAGARRLSLPGCRSCPC
jgi:hypothetical protein